RNRCQLELTPAVGDDGRDDGRWDFEGDCCARDDASCFVSNSADNDGGRGWSLRGRLAVRCCDDARAEAQHDNHDLKVSGHVELLALRAYEQDLCSCRFRQKCREVSCVRGLLYDSVATD